MKKDKQPEFEALIALGNNPYNFFSKIHEVLTGSDPNTGHINIQSRAIRNLEQLSLNRWTKGKEIS